MEERAEEYDSESDKKLMMKKVMKQMRSGQYFLVILAIVLHLIHATFSVLIALQYTFKAAIPI